ncbi:MAG TPA: UbiH/UbiF/VisC/COQ6 family ubiquinone biosynthesis hydroxylase [Mariprofundaceae bacterium]|nr:UbiH/UbiF/VisC/COQ6 family ubiquinone biosynthesis hydroxylase [Mariprofundaceae bacterium]
MSGSGRDGGRMQQVDVIIVGGGMVGLVLACALRDRGLQVVLVERAESEARLSLGRDCRVSAIVAGTAEILRGIGVWPRVDDGAGAIRGMRVWDDQRFGSIRFEAEEVGLDVLGYILENSRLQSAMREVLTEDASVEVCCPAEIESVAWHADAVHVTLDDGRMLSASLVVGADGGRSWLRREGGVGICEHDLGQRAIVATVRSRLSNRQTAFQRFLPTGPLAFLPLSAQLSSIVWSAEKRESERLMALDDTGFMEALDLAFGPVLGGVEAVGERAAFPLRSQLARRMVHRRMALIGDAAHVIHPLAGLGVNLGIRDAMVLAQEIVDAHRFREDIGDMSVLERFARARLPDNLSTLAGMELFHHLFTSRVPGVGLIRYAGMLMVGNSGPVKRMLMRTGMGLSLPVPGRIG